jgi:hypothetical protein
MREFRQPMYCVVDMDELKVERLVHAFQALAENLPDAAASVRLATELSRRALVAQYDRVFKMIDPQPDRG